MIFITLQHGLADFKSVEIYREKWEVIKFHDPHTFASGSKYVGEIKDGKYNGQGTVTFASGEKYDGEWKDGKYNGQGTLFASNGSIINQGIFADNKFIPTHRD